MANYNLRTTDRFDYRIYHSTGKKIFLPAEAATKETMPSEAKVAGELTGLFFQMDESLEDLTDLSALSLEDLRRHQMELKSLRVAVVQISSELRLLQGDRYSTETDGKVEEKLSLSKKMLTTLKAAISAEGAKICETSTADMKRVEVKNDQKRKAQEFAQDCFYC